MNLKHRYVYFTIQSNNTFNIVVSTTSLRNHIIFYLIARTWASQSEFQHYKKKLYYIHSTGCCFSCLQTSRSVKGHLLLCVCVCASAALGMMIGKMERSKKWRIFSWTERLSLSGSTLW